MKGSQKTVVVADDSEVVGMLVEFYLKNEGYVVSLFSNGLDALHFIQENPVDLLITDMEMPLLDGCGLIGLVRSGVSGRMPVIAMSGSATSDLVETILNLGASDFLKKPFCTEQLGLCMKKLGI